MVSDVVESNIIKDYNRLNPSFCGIWSLTEFLRSKGANFIVLILLFVEYGL